MAAGRVALPGDGGGRSGFEGPVVLGLRLTLLIGHGTTSITPLSIAPELRDM